MKLTQYKKIIKDLPRDELEAHLFAMFKTSKAFKDVECSYWCSEYNDELLAGLENQLKRVFWKDRFSLSECKGVLKDYLNRTVDGGTRALMHLRFAAEAAEVSEAFGDYGDSFYNSLISEAGKYMDYAAQDPAFFSLHEGEFEALITLAESIGDGIAMELVEMLENVRCELGYCEESEEDE